MGVTNPVTLALYLWYIALKVLLTSCSIAGAVITNTRDIIWIAATFILLVGHPTGLIVLAITIITHM